ncbi:hypothetical protein [Massilia eburnea]|uniref:hypothetical protein n=1 Tax=Massilia eburnea TaxID=1776165 RepID=UPI003D6C2DF7
MKKTSNCRHYQESAVSGRESAIKEYLKSLKRSRAEFEHITSLATAVAAQLTIVEKRDSPCSYTTLLRNETYKSHLHKYMLAKGSGATTKVSDPIAQARIHLIELDLANAKRDNERLRLYISDLEERVSREPALAPPVKALGDSANEIVLLSNERAQACKALWLVLEHFEGLVSVDSGRGCIIDLGAPLRSNVIVDRDAAKVFLDWLSANSWIGK